MDIQLPDVDDLIQMAQDDPEALERLREQLCAQVIANAPRQYQRRLNGLQFQINMERMRASNSLHSCIKISQMMMECYQELQLSLEEIQNNQTLNSQNLSEKTADIINFKKAAEKS
jgi:hypothetical protein